MNEVVKEVVKPIVAHLARIRGVFVSNEDLDATLRELGVKELNLKVNGKEVRRFTFERRNGDFGICVEANDRYLVAELKEYGKSVIVFYANGIFIAIGGTHEVISKEESGEVATVSIDEYGVKVAYADLRDKKEIVVSAF